MSGQKAEQRPSVHCPKARSTPCARLRTGSTCFKCLVEPAAVHIAPRRTVFARLLHQLQQCSYNAASRLLAEPVQESLRAPLTAELLCEPRKRLRLAPGCVPLHLNRRIGICSVCRGVGVRIVTHEVPSKQGYVARRPVRQGVHARGYYKVVVCCLYPFQALWWRQCRQDVPHRVASRRV